MKRRERKITRGGVLAGLGLLLGGAWAGCGAPSSPPGQERFGDPYEILTNFSPDSPDEPPAIVGDSLSALVAYGGGCARHTFEPRVQTTGRVATILLRHDNGGDRCRAYLRDRIAAPLPEKALEAREIRLLNPNNADEPFVLRWDLAQD